MTTAAELGEKNPFPGLRSFKPHEAARFFGREKQIRELVLKLEESSFLAVAGTSGCGKSSLVLAGVLCELCKEGESRWRSVVLQPGNHPIANLAEQLSKVLGTSAGLDPEFRVVSLEGQLRLGGMGLIEAVRVANLGPQERILVVVDQFEEIFRFKEIADREEAAAFVKLLLAAADTPESPVSVVLTLRSDSLGLCENFRGLPEAINKGQYLVPKLTREQRKDAIIKPIESAGQQISPRLVQRLLNDVADNFDDLPVMQHVLYRTWWQWAKAGDSARIIDVADYEAVGTAENALSNHADEACDSINDSGSLVEKVFRALTERVAAETDIRRPLDFHRLCRVVGENREKVGKVIGRFSRPDTGFLNLPSGSDLDKNPAVDISHESLIRLWKKLRTWVQTEAEAKAELLRLVVDAEVHARNQGELLAGRNLERALQWEKTNRPNEDWVALCSGGDGKEKWSSVHQFLRASERARKASESAKKKWERRTYWALSVLIGLAIFALYIQNSLLQSSSSKELSSRAWTFLKLDPARSAQLALAALDQDGKNANAERVLRQSVADLEIAHTEKIFSFGSPIKDARFNSDTTKLVIATGNTVFIFQGARFQDTLGVYTRSSPIKKAWLLPGDTLLLTWTEDSIARMQLVTGAMADTFSCQDRTDFIYSMTVSGNNIAIGCMNGEISQWHVQGSKIGRRETFVTGIRWFGVTITALDFSYNSEYLASGDANGTVNIWKSGQKGPWIGAKSEAPGSSQLKHTDVIRDICFSPLNSSFLATGSDDGTAKVLRLDLEKRRLAKPAKDSPSDWVLRHEDPVTAVRFYPNENPLLTISGKRVSLWSSEIARESNQVEDWATNAAISPDGKMAITGCANGTATVWSTQTSLKIAALRGHKNSVSHVFFGMTGQVVTASEDGDVRIWRLHVPKVEFYSKKWVSGAAFDPSGQRFAVCEKKNTDSDSAYCRIVEPFDGENNPSAKLDSVAVDQVGFLSWSPNGKLLVGFGNYIGILKRSKPVLWNVETGARIAPKWLDDYWTASFSPGTNELLAVHINGDVAVLDASTLATDNPAKTLPVIPHLDKANFWWAAMSPDGQWIAAITDRRIAVYNRRDSEMSPRILTGYRGDAKTVEFSPDSRSLVTASSDGTARIWQLDKPQGAGYTELAGGHVAGLSYASFSRDGKWVATSGSDGAVCVWDARSGRILTTLNRHSEGVNQLSFGPEREILSASDDGAAVLGGCNACGQTLEQLRKDAARLALVSSRDSL